MPISSSRSRAAKKPLVPIKHLVSWPEHPSLDTNELHSLAIKSSFAPSGGLNNTIIEPRLLRECSGMFGIPKQLCSCLAHHQDGYPTTDHLFRPPPGKEKEYYWDAFSTDHSHPEYRSLTAFDIAFVGKSLVSAPDVSSMVQALVHAHLGKTTLPFTPYQLIINMIGYYNMCQKNFQHRDINIGNVLMVDEAIPSKPFAIEQPNDTEKRILEICESLGIKDTCRGFLIDDMAIDWNTHSGDDYDGSESVRTSSSRFLTAGRTWQGNREFMSKALLERDSDTIHSPTDDYWSFYFTAQWACVYRKAPSGEGKKLQSLRKRLAGNHRDRDSGTSSIVDEPPNVDVYGSFLTEIQPFLRAWNQALKDLQWKWSVTKREEVNTFRRYAAQGLLSFLEVACLYYQPIT